MHNNLKSENIFAGIVSIAGLVVPEGETGEQLKANSPPGIPILAPEAVADQHWFLYTERSQCEAIVGDEEEILSAPGFN